MLGALGGALGFDAARRGTAVVDRVRVDDTGGGDCCLFGVGGGRGIDGMVRERDGVTAGVGGAEDMELGKGACRVWRRAWRHVTYTCSARLITSSITSVGAALLYVSVIYRLLVHC